MTEGSERSHGNHFCMPPKRGIHRLKRAFFGDLCGREKCHCLDVIGVHAGIGDLVRGKGELSQSIINYANVYMLELRVCVQKSQRPPLKKIHDNRRRIKIRPIRIIAIRLLTRPRMAQPLHAIMRNQPQLLPFPKPIPLHLPIIQLRRLILLRPQTIPPSPFAHHMRHGGQTLPPAPAAGIRDRLIRRTMELEERDFGAPRIALDVDGGGIAVLLGDVVLVVGARDGGEGGDALRGGCVAGQTVGEAAAVGLARGVDTGGVEAVGVFKVCEHLHGEGDVVDSVGVGVALPFFLYHLLAALFFFLPSLYEVL